MGPILFSVLQIHYFFLAFGWDFGRVDFWMIWGLSKLTIGAARPGLALWAGLRAFRGSKRLTWYRNEPSTLEISAPILSFRKRGSASSARAHCNSRTSKWPALFWICGHIFLPFSKNNFAGFGVSRTVNSKCAEKYWTRRIQWWVTRQNLTTWCRSREFWSDEIAM